MQGFSAKEQEINGSKSFQLLRFNRAENAVHLFSGPYLKTLNYHRERRIKPNENYLPELRKCFSSQVERLNQNFQRYMKFLVPVQNNAKRSRMQTQFEETMNRLNSLDEISVTSSSEVNNRLQSQIIPRNQPGKEEVNIESKIVGFLTPLRFLIFLSRLWSV